MAETAILETIESLSERIARLERRVEDLEDLRELEEAIAKNAGKPLIPWEAAQKDLEIE